MKSDANGLVKQCNYGMNKECIHLKMPNANALDVTRICYLMMVLGSDCLTFESIKEWLWQNCLNVCDWFPVYTGEKKTVHYGFGQITWVIPSKHLDNK